MTEPARYSLHNDQLHVEISSKGAELQSIIANGIERLWEGDPTVWGRKAPLLFPLIGRLRNQTYEYHSKPIEAPMHGFCRDRLFSVEQLSNSMIRFSTKADDSTRKVYPFDFELTITYALNENTLAKTHSVKNRGENDMPFEIGGHEAYATRLLPGETMADYYIQFENGTDSLKMFSMDEGGILSLPKMTVPLEQDRLTQTPEQLSIDTIVLEHVPGSQVTLGATTNSYTTTVTFPDFPYLGIWTMAGQPDPRYICIEPWSALPDAYFSPRELSEKPGVRTLAPGEETHLTYLMTFA